VVEDFSTMVRILRNLLRQIGLHDVDDAPGGSIALLMMRKRRYELLIVDCNMPGMSGYELLREVRNDPSVKLTPVLLMTADPSVGRFVTETDLTQYLIKPFSAEMLKVKIQNLLSPHPQPRCGGEELRGGSAQAAPLIPPRRCGPRESCIQS
jgi:two-component system, chemotaxis family, chemotaxis protein CheY